MWFESKDNRYYKEKIEILAKSDIFIYMGPNLKRAETSWPKPLGVKSEKGRNLWQPSNIQPPPQKKKNSTTPFHISSSLLLSGIPSLPIFSITPSLHFVFLTPPLLFRHPPPPMIFFYSCNPSPKPTPCITSSLPLSGIPPTPSNFYHHCPHPPPPPLPFRSFLPLFFFFL